MSRRIRSSTAGELLPQAPVAVDEVGGDVDRVEPLGEVAAGGEVHQLAGDVGLGQVEVVLALPVAQAVVQLARLGVDEIGGEGSRVAPGNEGRAIA